MAWYRSDDGGVGQAGVSALPALRLCLTTRQDAREPRPERVRGFFLAMVLDWVHGQDYTLTS